MQSPSSPLSSSAPRLSSSGARRPSVSRNSEVERIIASADVDTTFAGKKAIRYRGRRSVWPGAVVFLLVILGAAAGLVFYGLNLHKDMLHRTELNGGDVKRFGTGTWINDGTDAALRQPSNGDIINPEEYKDQGCTQPNFLSKDGMIVADYGSSKVTLQVKGVNWLGMQGNGSVPQGLWDNTQAGNSIYRIGKFLVDNHFNMVRLPLAIDSVLRNVEVDQNLVNTYSNRALIASRYLDMLGLVIQGLGRQGLGVVLDFHILSSFTNEDNSLWYGTSIRLDDIKTAITNLATTLCKAKYYNIVGLDLKDDIGGTATWGDGSDTDWAAAATTLGNHMLSKCPNWLAFIQGVQGSSHKDDFGNRSLKWKFLNGSDLSATDKIPIKLTTAEKVVYSPKYWSSSMQPQPFFFDSGTQEGDLVKNYTESDDTTLKANVMRSMDLMFGSAIKTKSAVVLSSFGGLTGTEDKTAKKTSSRIMKFVIEKMTGTENAIAGGFWWTLNPGTYWPFSVPDSSDNGTTSGLVDTTWREANMNDLEVLKDMDSLKNAVLLPCTAP